MWHGLLGLISEHAMVGPTHTHTMILCLSQPLEAREVLLPLFVVVHFDGFLSLNTCLYIWLNGGMQSLALLATRLRGQCKS